MPTRSPPKCPAFLLIFPLPTCKLSHHLQSQLPTLPACVFPDGARSITAKAARNASIAHLTQSSRQSQTTCRQPAVIISNQKDRPYSCLFGLGPSGLLFQAISASQELRFSLMATPSLQYLLLEGKQKFSVDLMQLADTFPVLLYLLEEPLPCPALSTCNRKENRSLTQIFAGRGVPKAADRRPGFRRFFRVSSG